MGTGRFSLIFISVAMLVFAGCGADDAASGGNDQGVSALACADGVDNDGDSLIDLDDPGCNSERDDDETNLLIVSQCADLADNDNDGLTDLDDPGCSNADDDDESDDPQQPQCDDGVDNDGDGQIDLDDRGCSRRGDDDESDESPLAACGDGLDNDNDGFVDFPADPGCGSEFDGDESDDDGPTLPQCANGLDDDGDGTIDLADPGCSSVADPRELNTDGVPPACANQIDDDGDGVTDFPAEPGCSAAGDDDEADPQNAPACGNARDDDNDGQNDYPNDPGCAGVGDRDETDPPVQPACSDGVDNDRDGQIDYPLDRGCQSAADGSEGGACGRNYTAVETASGSVIRGDSSQGQFRAEGSCGGRGAPEIVLAHRVETPIEGLVVRTDFPDNTLETTLYIRRGCLDATTELICNREPVSDGVAANEVRLNDPSPGDYYIFVDGAGGRGGRFAVVVEEIPRAQCLNGLDDDADGRIDYPNDPGCYRADDRDETDPERTPECADGLDNDGDGVIDYPLDFGCRAAADDDEVDVCGQGVRVQAYPIGAPSVLVDTSMGSNNHSGSCTQGGGPETIFVYENPFNAELTVSVNHPDTIARTDVYMRTACGAMGVELGCDSGAADNQNRGEFTLERVPPGDYFIFVDHPFGLGGQVRLSIESTRLPAGCADQIDNDEDGFVDGDDVGCSGVDDEDERDPPDGEAPPPCFDGVDNDDDGIVDYPFDPGCLAKGDLDEADPAQAAECSNGDDDDDDGLIDFPFDVSCSAAADDSEEGERRAQCNNRIDDDQDGFTDYPNDPGCAAWGDMSEQDDPFLPACGDNLDNDRDGLVDFPFDPGCMAAGDRDETTPVPAAACANGADDDGDGLADFPLDPGCEAAGADSEDDPNFPPACSNGRDDDGNGRIDWPDDPGCGFAGDVVERSDGTVRARCADGVDNDQDGDIDLTDLGCRNALDDDEADDLAAPACFDGEDNDGDGQIDWPIDPGCAARGDVCEQGGHGICGGLCVDLENDGSNCGQCGNLCPGDLDCIDGLCGGVSCRVLQDVYFAGPNGGQFNVNTQGQPSSGTNCGGGGPQSVVVITLAAARNVVIETSNASYDTYLQLRSECDDPASQIVCNDDGGAGLHSRISRRLEAGTYYGIIDGFAGRSGTTTVQVTITP